MNMDAANEYEDRNSPCFHPYYYTLCYKEKQYMIYVVEGKKN